ncbi:GH85 family endohexosaminidase C-terminal domain-containing protein [Streptomyces sp. NPDC054786]
MSRQPSPVPRRRVLREAPAPGEPAPYSYLPAGVLEPGSGWRTTSLRLGSAGPGTVHALGVRLTGRAGAAVAWRLGALAVRDTAGSPAAPSGLTVIGTATTDGATAVRLSWRRATGRVRHYELHRRFPEGKREFLGGTCGTAFYVPGLRPAPGEPAARLEVRAVHELFTVSKPSTTQLPW